jgi:hypothetical protein
MSDAYRETLAYKARWEISALRRAANVVSV